MSSQADQLSRAVLIVALKKLVAGPKIDLARVLLDAPTMQGELVVKNCTHIVAAQLEGFDGAGIQAVRKLLPAKEGTVTVDTSTTSTLKQELNVDLVKLLTDLQAAADRADQKKAGAAGAVAATAAAEEVKPVTTTTPVQAAEDSEAESGNKVADSSEKLQPVSPVVEIAEKPDSIPPNTEVVEASQPISSTVPESDSPANSFGVRSSESSGEDNVAKDTESSEPAKFIDDVPDYRIQTSYESERDESNSTSSLEVQGEPVEPQSNLQATHPNKVGQVASRSLIKKKKIEDTGNLPSIESKPAENIGTGFSASELDKIGAPNAAPLPSSQTPAGAAFDISELNSIPSPSASSPAGGTTAGAETAPSSRNSNSSKMRSISTPPPIAPEPPAKKTEPASSKSGARKVGADDGSKRTTTMILGGVLLVAVAIGGINAFQASQRSSLYSQLEKSFADDKIEDSKALMKTALKQYPDDPSTHFFNARLLAKEGQLDKSISEYNIAIGLAPENERFLAFRGRALVSSGDMKAGLTDLNRALEKPSKDPYPYISRALALLSTGDIPKAIADAQKGVSLDPKNVGYQSTLAIVYSVGGKNPEAIKAWTAILDKDKTSYEAYVGRATAEINNGQVPLAMQDFDKALALKQSKSGSAYYARGMFYTTQKKYGPAIQDFNAAVKIEPQNKLYWSTLSKAYKSAGDVKGALAVYKRSNGALGSESPESIRDRLQLEIGSASNQQILADTELLLGKAPGDLAARKLHAEALIKAEKYSRAIDDFSALIEKTPNNASLLAKRGWLNAKLHHFDLSDHDFDKAGLADKKGKNADVYLYRGMAEAEKGQFKDAVADINRSLALNPQNGFAKAQLAEISKKHN